MINSTINLIKSNLSLSSFNHNFAFPLKYNDPSDIYLRIQNEKKKSVYKKGKVCKSKQILCELSLAKINIFSPGWSIVPIQLRWNVF